MFVVPHPPERGRDRALRERRVTLDDILVRAARRTGAVVLEGHGATAVIGQGTAGDPVRGLACITPQAEEMAIDADIVIGADGVNSTLAPHLGLDREKVTPTDTMLCYAYWTGVDTRNTQDFFFGCPWVCAHFPADDSHHVVTMKRPADARKDIGDLQAFYLEKINAIPVLAARLKTATQVSRVTATMRLDRFSRQHTGPGWARSSRPWTDVIPHVPGMADLTGASVAEVLVEFPGNRRAAAPLPSAMASA